MPAVLKCQWIRILESRKVLLLLNGIEFQNRKIKIQDAKTRAVPVSPNKNKHQRPQLVTNKNPEKQHSFSTKSKYAPEKKPTSPSHEKSSKENIVFGDSIQNFSKSTKNEINTKLVSRGRAKFKYFPVATSNDLLHYIDSTLEDIRKYYLLENIQKMVKKCESYGIEKVLISGLIFATRYSENILIDYNRLSKILCDVNGYFYIDNGKITLNQLFGDGLHLLENGKQLLAQNFVTNVINSFVSIYATLV